MNIRKKQKNAINKIFKTTQLILDDPFDKKPITHKIKSELLKYIHNKKNHTRN